MCVLASSAAAACGSSSAGDGVQRGTDNIDVDGWGGDDENGAPALSAGPIDDEKLESLRESACTGWSFEPELSPSVLQLVVDVSGSMDLPPSGGSETKWVTTREALRDTVERLPVTTSLGAVYYPNQDTRANCEGRDSPCVPGPPQSASECVNLSTTVAVAALGPPGSRQRRSLDDSLDSARPSGGTPTHDAYNVALTQLLAARAPGLPFLLLITDGQPTFLEGCSGSGYRVQPVDEQPIIDAISSARAMGVRTFVVGSPGSEENADTGSDARPWLSRAAIEGGTAGENCDRDGPNYCHFDMSQEADFGAALRTALGEIVGQIGSCSLTVPPAPEGETLDPDAVNVVLSPSAGSAEVVGRASEQECGEGWRYSVDGQTIELCSETCRRVQNDPEMGLELFFGCRTAENGVR